MSSQTPRAAQPNPTVHWTRMRSVSAPEILGILKRSEDEPRPLLDMVPWKLVAPRAVTVEAG